MATSDSWASIARDMFPEDGNDHAVAFFFFISYLCIGTVCARAPRFASHRPRAAVYAAARMLTGCWMHVACTLWHMLCMHASCGTCCSAISTEHCSHTDARAQPSALARTCLAVAAAAAARAGSVAAGTSKTEPFEQPTLAPVHAASARA